MNYKKFQEVLAARVQGLLEGKATVALHRLPRNNGVWKESLDICEPGASLTPSIHMDYFYQEYQKGVSVDHLAQLICDEYRNFKENHWIPRGFFNSYRKVKENVFCKVISYDRNKRFLVGVPHRRWCDLAFVYYYRVPEEYCRDAAILIRSSQLERWEVREEDLEKDAWRNTTEKLQPQLQKLDDLLREWGEQVPEMGEIPVSRTLYLLTNQDKCLGANCIFYPGQAEEVGKMLNGDFYVLPSSIHECLILAADQGDDAEHLQKMVAEINRTQVDPQEVLSDHVYYYSRTLHRLDICP